MKINAVELRRVHLPLKAPFRTSFGVETARDVLFVKVETPDAQGWGECVAMDEPLYSSEYVDAAQDVIKRFILPYTFAADDLTAERFSHIVSPIRGHRMAKAAVETAILDAELREGGTSFGTYFGASKDRVPCGVSVGIADSIPQLLDQVDGYLASGYVRIKLKIEPGWDIEPVKAVRERFGDILLQVDANAAYTLADGEHLAQLDPFDLLLIEQPLLEERVLDHAELAKVVKTPICLDESIIDADMAVDAIKLGACKIINIKPGRMGGYIEAKRTHDVCAANGIPVWCGGMLESGIGRAANVALAALPNFTLPGDTSASERYFTTDITEPFVLDDGHLDVPTGPGIGVDPIPEILEALTTSVEVVRP
ncbi:MAG: o-succinylbenzoate synthase [Actinomycetota bacterium]